ncbi:MAG: aminotransferase class I/II-fold pyridoxal phosphate-dependent enzyme [Bacillota bacterium]
MEYAIDQKKAPLVEAVARHVGSGYTAFHVPGHKGWRTALPGLGDLLGERVALADLSEVGDHDDLQWPCGAIEEAQMLAAVAFGADEAFFLVNGVTCGIQAAIAACASGGGRVVIPRNVHRSVIGALALADADPVYVVPEVDPSTGIAGGLPASTLERALDQSPRARAVLLVHPTYYGVAGDIRELVKVAHLRGIPVILDEAHGAHFAFHPALPPAGMHCGADVCVAGCHKTAGAFTQAAVMMVRGSLVDRDLLRACLRTLQTTSPSYLLMASLDASRRLMATRGMELLGGALALSEEVRDRINDLAVFKCPGDEWTGRPGFFELDRTKLTVVAPGGGDCRKIERELRERFGIVIEFSAPGHFLAVMSYADDAGTAGRLAAALEALALEQCKAGGGIDRGGRLCEDRGAHASIVPHVPEQAVSLRRALFSPSEWRDLGRSGGAVSADTVAAYPPGIPALCPGEAVDEETIEILQASFRGGLHVHGIRVSGDRVQIRVLRENPSRRE